LERIVYKSAVLTFKVMHGIAPEYFGPVVRVAYLPGRQSLHSAGTNRLVVPLFKLSTISTQAFPVANPRVWNSLPADITSAPLLSTFRQRLKTYLFRQSFLISPFNNVHSLSGPCGDIHLGHFKKTLIDLN